MRKQLNDCLHRTGSHTECSEATSPYLPTRIIKVGTEFQNPTLYTSQPNETGRYTALSYCWGGPQEQITTTANLQERTNEIPLKRLPKTFQDAIAITRVLGIQYLWIDALCILQDSEEDKISEVNDMGRVYAGATLTIAAANSDNAKGGFFKEYSRPVSCQLPFRLPNGTIGKIDCVWDRDVNRQRQQDPLELRGWTFQEAVLSNRILYFGTEDLTWRCQSINRNLNFERAPVGVHSVQIPSEDEVSVRREERETMFRAKWAAIVETYSGRTLSFPEDRLPALAGIATEWSKSFHFEGTYLAGLWKSWLICHLGWTVTSPKDEISTSDSFSRLSPSWSWLSVKSKVKIFSVDHEYAVLKECMTDLAYNASPFGNVHGGRLTLQAPVAIATTPIFLPAEQSRGTPILSRSLSKILFHRKRVEVHLDISPEPLEQTTPHYLLLGRTLNNWAVGLILQPFEEGTFIRIGQVMVHSDDVNTIWPGSTPSQILTII